MVEPRINTGTPLASVIGGIEDPSMRSIIGKMDATEREGKELARKSVEKMEAEPKPLPPKLTAAPDLKDYQRSPMESFGSAAGFMATFGSLLTRRPLTNALNAAASVMDAANKQDAATFSRAFDKWKVETENSWKMADWEMSQYKEVLGKDEKEAEIFAKSIKNDTALAAIQARMGEQYHRDMIKQLENSKKPAETMFQFVEDGLKAEDDRRKSQGLPPMTATEYDMKKMALFGEAKNVTSGKGDTSIPIGSDIDWKNASDNTPVPRSGLTVGAIRQAVEGVYKTGSINQAGLGYGWNPAKQAVDNAMSAMHPDFNRGDAYKKYQAEVAAQKAFGSGKQGDIIRSLDVTIDHLDTFNELAEAMNNGNIRAINSAKNKFSESFGSEAPTDLSVAKEILGDEVTKAIIGGAGSLTDREDIKKKLDDANSWQQFSGVSKTLKKLMAGQLSGLKRQYKTSTESDDFEEKLSPSAKRELGGLSESNPLSVPDDKKFVKGKYYDLSDDGHGVHKYLGNGEFE